MFSVAHAGNAANFIRFRFPAHSLWSGTSSPDFKFGFVVSSEFYETGVRPETSQEMNRFRDKNCNHFNITGNVTLLSTVDAVQSPVSRYYSYRGSSCYLRSAQYKVNNVNYHWIGAFDVDGYTLETPWHRSYSVASKEVKQIWTLTPQGKGLYRFSQHHMTRKVNTEGPLIDDQFNCYLVQYDLIKGTLRYGIKSFANGVTPNWDLVLLTTTQALGTTYRYTLKGVLGQTDYVNARNVRDTFLGRTLAADQTHILLTVGDLAQTAASNTKYVDINMPMYFSDFLKFKSTLEPFLKLLRGKIDAKGLANAYLSFRYGVKLTVKDTEELTEAYRKFKESELEKESPDYEELPFLTTRARTSEAILRTSTLGYSTLVGTRYYNLKMYYDRRDDALSKFINEAMAWDVYPSLQNIWDYIPFSFVLDWFIGVENQLERMDHKGYIQTLRIYSTLVSTRDVFEVEAWTVVQQPPGVVVCGNLNIAIYSRKVWPYPPQPISRFDVPQSFNSWIEGTALFIQRAL